MCRMLSYLLVIYIFSAGVPPAMAAGYCAGVCEYCAVPSERGCARCSVNERCLKTLKSPKQKYRRVPSLQGQPKLKY